MARIPVPQQGQPIDLGYISTIVSAVNQLSEPGTALTQGNNFILSKPPGTPSAQKLYGAQIIAQELFLTAGTSDEATQTVNFSPYNFSTEPIVLATLVEPLDLQANVSVKSVTSSSATVVVKFTSSENNSTKVSIMAIGLPASIS